MQKKITPKTAKALLLLTLLSGTLCKAQQGPLVQEQVQQKETPLKKTIPRSPKDISPLLIGETLPVHSLPDAAGHPVNLQQLITAKPTILVFYRGGWCPYCSRQLSGLQTIEPALLQSGYQIVAISTDKPAGLRQSMESQQLHYTLLSDADLSLSTAVGIAYQAPENYRKMLPVTTGGKDTALLLPVPAVFILNRKGQIQFEYINPDFRQRLNPDLLKAAAISLQPTLS